MFEKPTIDDLRKAADRLGMNPTQQYLNTMQEIVAPLVQAYAELDAMSDEKPAVNPHCQKRISTGRQNDNLPK